MNIGMNNQDFNGEINYSLTMTVVKHLKEKGIISDDEYKQTDAELLKKYRPVLSILLSDIYFSD